MLKQEFIYNLKEEIFHSGYDYSNDKPAINLLFNQTKDDFGKDGIITENQCQNWVLTKREARQLLKIADKAKDY